MPRLKPSRGHRPSPLAQEVHLRSLSVQLEDMTVPDPLFWKRFSAAIHEAEGADIENERVRATSASTSESVEKARLVAYQDDRSAAGEMTGTAR
jgi:hypothetical protein